MEEELISFETAKLANDKGWKFPYTIEYLEEIEGTVKYFDSLPTQSLLQRWLREVHMIKVIANHAESNGTYKFSLWIWEHNNSVGKWKRSGFFGTFLTYEQALEAGLLEGLKLIK